MTRASRTIVEGGIFLEPPEMEGRLGLALKIDKILLHKKTKYQELHVVESGPLGRVLLLDGAIQLTTWDEPAYHEMMAHVPLLSHPDPRRVLIIGGGDGGTLREVLRHPGVERCDLCEIDGEVIQAAKEFIPQVASAFDHPKARVHVGDGLAFVKEARAAYDVILVDSSDPEGPALGLFGKDFYSDVKEALMPGGMAVSQAESCNFFGPMLKNMFRFMDELFPLTLFYLVMVPTYIGGSIGFAVNSLGPDPTKGPHPDQLAKLGGLKYFTPALHRAAFALPAHYAEFLTPDMTRRQIDGA
jgi:spermidine synthase